jgi:glycosyltransferase involved in cell wall biosynthesis
MKASIIVINYNDKIRVGRAIESALAQTWKDTEVIVVDDGSDKETRKIYERFDGRVKLIQLERDDAAKRTPSRARNAGIAVATGDYLAVLDSDNYFEPGFVEKAITHDVDVTVCDWRIIGKQNYHAELMRTWGIHPFQQDDNAMILSTYLAKCQVDHQCLLMRTSYLKKVGLYDERLPRSQDCDLIVRLILGGGVWKHIPHTLFIFEKHEDDQHKAVASVHGKTLWTLKNNVNFTWLAGMASQSPYFMQSIIQGVIDFGTSPEWADVYAKSEYKGFREAHLKMLTGEREEK